MTDAYLPTGSLYGKPESRPRKSREIPCEIMASLYKGNRTIQELCDMVGVKGKVIRLWIDAMHASGLVYVAGMKGQAVVYGIQTKPFELPDEVPLHRWSRKAEDQ